MDVTADSPSPARPSRSPSPSSSAISVAGNEDILIEILIRSPAKSLIRFKTVCKHWHSLISSHHFSLLHTLRNKTTKLSGLILRKTPSLHPTADPEFDFVPLNGTLSRSPPFRSLNFILRHNNQTPNSGIKILQSCNGLFICCSFPHTIGTCRNYYIANPTTKQYIPLEPPTNPNPNLSSATIIGLSLAFDPAKSPHYNVICVRSTESSMYCYQIEVYSSETRAWRVSGQNFTAPFDMVFTDGVFWNGGIHWISPSGASMAFRVDSERLETIPAIPVLRRDWGRRYRYFGESNGHLHLIEVHGPHTSQLHVFELERDYSKWCLRYTVNLEGIVAAFPLVRRHGGPIERSNHAFSILSVYHGENEDDSVLVINVPCKVITYNLKSGFLTELLDFTPPEADKRNMLQFGCFDTYQYAETLAPV